MTLNRTQKHLSIESSLSWQGVALNHWHLEGVADKVCPEGVTPAEKLHIFQYSTVEGLIGINPDCLRVIAVINKQRGNGAFMHFLNALIRTATFNSINVEFVEIWNDKLFHKLEGLGFTGDKRCLRWYPPATSSVSVSSP
jgi:hypothetical protein